MYVLVLLKNFHLVVVTLSGLEVFLDHRVLLEAPVVFVLLLQQLLKVVDGELILGKCQEGHKRAGVESDHHNDKYPPSQKYCIVISLFLTNDYEYQDNTVSLPLSASGSIVPPCCRIAP